MKKTPNTLKKIKQVKGDDDLRCSSNIIGLLTLQMLSKIKLF